MLMLKNLPKYSSHETNKDHLVGFVVTTNTIDTYLKNTYNINY
jgi:hypothetical protein